MPDRYLLCRPRGGLNDTLCRIAVCWDYAARVNRCLVIDTSDSGLRGQFGDIFEFVDHSVPVITSVDEELLAHLNTLPCRPAGLTGRLHDYTARFRSNMGLVDAERGEPTRFDGATRGRSDRDFPEPLLVYHDSGGGTDSFGLLPRIRLNESIAAHVRAALASIPRPYHAVHVRNTDYRTDYEALFARIRERVGTSPLLVCSDDPAVIAYARGYFRGPVLSTNRVHASSHPSGALHRVGAQPSPEATRQAVVDSLIDLFCLANAQTLYCTRVHARLDSKELLASGRIIERPLYASPASGYSLLAQHLCVNKHVADALLGEPEPESQVRTPGAAIHVETRSLTFRMIARILRLARMLTGRDRITA